MSTASQAGSPTESRAVVAASLLENGPEPPRRGLLRGAWLTILGITGAAAAGFLLAEFWRAVRSGELHTSFLVWLVTFQIGAWVCTVAHEFGHMLAGRLVRFRTTFFTVAPLRWSRLGKEWEFRWEKSLAPTCNCIWPLPARRRGEVASAAGVAFLGVRGRPGLMLT